MIFSQWKLVLNGKKTRTRRRVKPGELAQMCYGNVCDKLVKFGDLDDFCGQDLKAVRMASGRLKWRCDKDYAVQPKRARPSVGRFTLSYLTVERLQDLTVQEALAEGYPYSWPPPVELRDTAPNPIIWYAMLWNQINDRTGHRWLDNPLVWVLGWEPESVVVVSV